MPHFKIVDDCHSFRLLGKGCCQIGCKNKGRKKTAVFDKYSDYLVKGAYLFCSALIIYSLLVFNGLLASDVGKPGNNFLIVSSQGIGAKVNEVWLDTVIFMDTAGSLMGEPLSKTIQIYSRALAKVFVTTGNFLAQVPEFLTGPPPFAQAKGYNNW